MFSLNIFKKWKVENIFETLTCRRKNKGLAEQEVSVIYNIFVRSGRERKDEEYIERKGL